MCQRHRLLELLHVAGQVIDFQHYDVRSHAGQGAAIHDAIPRDGAGGAEL